MQEVRSFCSKCSNQRITVIDRDGNIHSEDEEEEGNFVGGAIFHDSKQVGLESNDELIEGMQALVVLRMLNVQPKHEEHKEQRNNIFHMKYWVNSKGCLVIIDGGSCTNVMSELLVAKLELKPLKHRNPYKLQWLGEISELRVKAQCLVPLKIGDLVDEVLCDIIPMTTCHVLLGRPLEFDRKDYKNGYTNEYFYMFNGVKVTLKPMLPSVVFEAIKYLQREREKERVKRQKSEVS